MLTPDRARGWKLQFATLSVTDMPYDSTNCQNCPYWRQGHLPTGQRTDRKDPPIELESHNSKTLIVALAPGIEEWKVGAPLQPIKKQGGTAGARIAQSWERTGIRREDFDLLNAVQCYPGVDGARDATPDDMAVLSCANRLDEILAYNGYDRVICLGDVAAQVVTRLRDLHNFSFLVKKCRHPTGGAERTELDSLW